MALTKITSHVIGSGAVTAASLSGITTDNVSEGSSNTYFTNARARGSVSVTGGNLSYDSSTGVIQLTTDTIRSRFSAGTGISISSGSISTSQDISTSATPTFGNITLGTVASGNITTTGYLRGPSTFTIDPATHGDNTGTVVIAGNLQVDGTTTTINSTTLTVDDKLVTLASGSANAGAANGAGIEVDISGATNPSILYDGTDDEFDFNKPITIENSSSKLFELDRSGTGNIYDLTISDAGTGAAQLFFNAQTNDTGFLFRPKNSSGNNVNALLIAPDGQLLINKTGSDVGASTNIVEADGNFRLQGGNRSIKFNNGSHEVVGLAQIASQKMQYASGRMTIDYGNSRVGIGTATYGVSPTHPLHVHMDVSNDTIDETKGLVKFQSTGGNGMIFGTLASSPYSSYIQSAYVVDTSLAQYNLALNPIGGNVGIGTSSPSNKLQITTSGAGNPYIGFDHTGDNPYMEMQRWSGTSSNYFGSRIKSYQGVLAFETTGSSPAAVGSQTFSESMRIDASGKVRIGATLGLNHLLNIQTASSSGLAQIEFRNTQAGTQIGMPANTNALSFFTADTERMRITSTGNVGIGAPNPVYGQLQIGDFTDATEALTFATSNNGNAYINFYDNNATEGMFIKTTGQSYGGNLIIGAKWDTEETEFTFTALKTGTSSFVINNGGDFTNANGDLNIHATSDDLVLTAEDDVFIQSGNGSSVKTVTLANNGQTSFPGDVLPTADNAHNLGSTSLRWANVYTTDLHLSNEGKEEGNEVDGTTGNWTIQEGEEHLYIINNKSGKKYKFALEEIE